MNPEKSLYNRIVSICLYLYAAFVFMFNADETKNSFIYAAFALLVGLLALNALRSGIMKTCREITLLILYFLFGFFSVIWAVDSSTVMLKVRTLLILIVGAFLLYDWITRTKRTETLLLAIIIGGLCEAIYFLSVYGLQEVFDAIKDGLRIGRQLDNLNAIGNSIALSLIALFGYALCFQRYKSLFLSIPMLIVLFAAGSRNSIISLVGGMAVVSFVQLKKLENKKLSQRLPTLILILAGVIVGWNFIRTMPFLEGITNRFEELENAVSGEIGGDSSAHTRIDYIRLGLEQFLKTPLLGNGLGCAGFVLKERYHYVTYLHNNFVEILTSGGIVGFLLYYGMYFLAIVKHIRLLKTGEPIVTASLGILCCELISHMGCVNYYSKIVYLLFVLWFSVGNQNFLSCEKEDSDEKGVARSE